MKYSMSKVSVPAKEKIPRLLCFMAAILPAIAYVTSVLEGASSGTSSIAIFGFCFLLLAIAAGQVPLIERHTRVATFLYGIVSAGLSLALPFFDPRTKSGLSDFTRIAVAISLIALSKIYFDHVRDRYLGRLQNQQVRAALVYLNRRLAVIEASESGDSDPVRHPIASALALLCMAAIARKL